MVEQTFQYARVERRFLPAVPVTLYHGSQSAAVNALLDSGSDYSILTADVARQLGIPIERGVLRPVTGIGGETKMFVHHATVKVLENAVPITACFLKNYSFPICILGRDFFTHHKILFEQKHQRVTIAEA